MMPLMHVIRMLAALSTAHAGVDPDALLAAAEKIRSPDVAYETKVGLIDEKGGNRETRTYEVLVKGRDKALARFLTPEIDRGGKVLFVDTDMWVHLPTAAKPLRISPRQKISGNAAYGDVVRLNFVGNYRARWKREDRFEKRRAQVLDLIAIDGRPVTYDRIEYWIDAENRRPLKALYQTAEGKTLRECYFDKFENVLGITRPRRFRLVDKLESSHVTTIVFSGERRRDIPALLFEKENFGRD